MTKLNILMDKKQPEVIERSTLFARFGEIIYAPITNYRSWYYGYQNKWIEFIQPGPVPKKKK